ncbi:tetratricopeptide repeat-containing sensor histidine kinase [Adhaeribacter aquaticus]|uniref:tetratricopeptide repeat-containing sensor histidine kinase n=1 Tax=Adhaeribacter aquaticus TaxID=299567 RepID=UPI00042A36AE|nr:ATP-binding protein [Adhaeribacter aquaticus]
MRLFLLLLFVACTNLRAQNKQLIDSLHLALDKATSLNQRVDLNCLLSKQYYLSDTKKGKAYALLADSLATKNNYLQGKAKALSLLGYAHIVAGEFDQGLKVYYQSLQVSEQINDTLQIIAAYNGLGNIYTKIEDRARATENYLVGLELAKKVADKQGQGKIYNNLGNIYEAQGNYKKGLAYFKRAAAIQETLNDKKSLAISLLNIGNIYLNFPHPEKGLPYLFKSLELDAQIQNKLNPVTTLKSIAQIYKATGNTKEALKYGTAAYEQALESGSEKKIVASAQLMKDIYVAKKDYEKAFLFQTVLDKHEANLNLLKQKEVAAEITAKYETARKELENHKLKAEKEKQQQEITHKNIVLAGAILLLVMLLILVIELIRSRRNIKAINQHLLDANEQLQVQHAEITNQQKELSAQAIVLKEQNQQLEQHNLFKNKIFSIISHDLRAPFGTVKGILDMVQAKNLSTEEIQHIFLLLSKDVNASINMLNNLLVWSKAQLAESKVNLEPTSLRRLVADNLQLISQLSDQKQLELINQVPDNLIVLTDKERLNFVLRNLIQNAMKFSSAGGYIKIEAKEDEEYLAIAVEDKGKGIAVKNLPKLFAEERFTTLGTQKEKGSGLGLKLCKEMLESLHGQIIVASEEGSGSSFTILLPNPALLMLQDKEKALVT